MRTLRKVWSRSRTLVRLARQMEAFLADPLSLEQANEVVRRGVEERENRFLKKLRTSVYDNPNSPYLYLLKLAGCEYGDLEQMVRRDGLDAALEKQLSSGVYVTFDEFKGRKPIVRGSSTRHFEAESFDDPNMQAEFIGSTGGSSGRPSAIRQSFAQTEQMAPHWCVFFEANGCLGSPLIYWRPGHAGATGSQLAWAKFGQRMDAWFISQKMTGLADRAYAKCLHGVAKRFAGMPAPRQAGYSDPKPVLAEIVSLLGRANRVSLNTPPSAAVRLSLLAQQDGVDLTGLTCMLGAEPLTEASRTVIEASGARATPLYGSNEATWIGGQCRQPQHADEVHVLRDLHAVIAGPASEELEGEEGSPLLFTSLAPITPKLLINVDIGDRGILNRRRCSCLYDELGCRQTIHQVRSSDKITGFGATFWVSDVHYVLESRMPRMLGGSPGDYQLIESLTQRGLPHYTLRVRPGSSGSSQAEIANTFFEELSRKKSYYGFMTAIWRREDALSVRSEAPSASPRGKASVFRRIATAELWSS